MDILPVVTFVLGQVVVLGLAYVQNRWATERDQRAAEVTREEARREFQRQTLLDLQVALHDLGRAWGRMFQEDDMRFQSTGSWGKNQYSGDWSERENDAPIRVAMYTSRVNDEEARTKAEKLQRLGADYVMKQEPSEATHLFMETTKLLTETTRRVGEVLRSV